MLALHSSTNSVIIGLLNLKASMHYVLYIIVPFFSTVIGNPVVFKVEGCGHQRSESSTDSFVCVSEETGLDGEGPRSESWEHLGSDIGGSGSRDSRAKLSEMGEEDTNGGPSNLLQKEQSILQSIELIGDKEKGGRAEDVDSNSSDLENWD